MKKLTPVISLFHIFSLGYVVKTNHKDCFCEPVIKVLPLEYINNESISNMLYKIRTEFNSGTTDKDISKLINPEKVKVKLKELISNSNVEWDKIDKEYQIERHRWIEATWLSFSLYNEYNPPCVNQGDIVILYKYGDMNTYFWEVIFKRTPEEHKIGEGSFKRYVESNPKQNKIVKEITVSQCTNDISYKIHCINYKTGVFNYLEMYNGNFNYFDQNGNILSINQNNEIYARAMENLTLNAKKNMYLLTDKNMDIIANNEISVSTRDLIIDAKNGVSVDAGHSFVVKGASITLQGNVVITGNLAIAGSVVPADCPCCCKCDAGGGGKGHAKTPPVDSSWKNELQNLEDTYKNRSNNKDSFIKQVKEFVDKIFTAITDKIGKGN